jgi:hypothetical protein
MRLHRQPCSRATRRREIASDIGPLAALASATHRAHRQLERGGPPMSGQDGTSKSVRRRQSLLDHSWSYLARTFPFQSTTSESAGSLAAPASVARMTYRPRESEAMARPRTRSDRRTALLQRSNADRPPPAAPRRPRKVPCSVQDPYLLDGADVDMLDCGTESCGTRAL